MPMSSGSGDKQDMHDQTGCFDPNTMDEGVENSQKDYNTNHNNINLEESFKPSVEELSYHNHQQLEDVSTYTNGFTPSSVDIEQQNLGLNIGSSFNNSNNNDMDNHLAHEVYQNSTWDPSVQDMDYINHQEHHQLSEQQYQQFVETQNHNQSYNPSSILDPSYSSPDLLNLLRLPRCSASSMLTTPSNICLTNPTQKAPNFHNSMSFLGDLPIGSSDNTSGSSVLYDPLFPLNLPPQPPALRELFQSLPHGYSMPTSSRNGSLFGGGDEMEGDGDMGVLEFNRATASVGKGRGGKATKHFATEKQRREQLNGKYKILRSLIPNPTKVNKQ
jgi:hypothetical protein